MNNLIQTKFYKIVRRNSTKLLSLAKVLPQNLEVEYKVNQWITPKHKKSKLFVFNELESATKYLKLCNLLDAELYECQVINPQKEILILEAAATKIPTVFQTFWENPREKHLDWSSPISNIILRAARGIRTDWLQKDKNLNVLRNCYMSPNNTYGCDAVKLIKKVCPI